MTTTFGSSGGQTLADRAGNIRPGATALRARIESYRRR